MPHQQLTSTSPQDGFSIARKVMADAVAFYLVNGGPSVAREHVERLANELKFYPDTNDAYLEALALIAQAEKEEQLRAEERAQQQQRDLMLTMMGVIKTGSPHKAAGPLCDGLPPKLSTPKAMLIWQRLQQSGYIDDRYQPVNLSRTLSAVLADEIMMLLANENDKLMGIDDKWRPFELLWNRRNMRADHYRSLSQRKADRFRTDIQALLSDIA